MGRVQTDRTIVAVTKMMIKMYGTRIQLCNTVLLCVYIYRQRAEYSFYFYGHTAMQPASYFHCISALCLLSSLSTTAQSIEFSAATEKAHHDRIISNLRAGKPLVEATLSLIYNRCGSHVWA